MDSLIIPWAYLAFLGNSLFTLLGVWAGGLLCAMPWMTGSERWTEPKIWMPFSVGAAVCSVVAAWMHGFIVFA